MSEQSNDGSRQGAARKPTWPALAIGLFVLLLILALTLPGIGRGFAQDVADATGGRPVGDPVVGLVSTALGHMTVLCLIPATIVWAIVYIPFVRPRAPHRAVRYYLILLLVPAVVTALYLGHVYDRAKAAPSHGKTAERAIGVIPKPVRV